MFERRNIGYLQSDFVAGDNVTEFIFTEIRKHHPGWKANELHHLCLVADKPFSLRLNGWEWNCPNGLWETNNAAITEAIVNENVTGLQMAFRYDD